MHTLTCYGECGATAENRTQDNSSTWARKNGWGCYSDVSNGLDLVVTCPECEKKVQQGINTIFEVFGEKARYIHFGACFKKQSP